MTLLMTAAVVVILLIILTAVGGVEMDVILTSYLLSF